MNYVVEKLEGRKREWVSCSQTVVETKYRVCKLEEGTEYTFRVAAENRFGIGEWAYTEPVIAKNPYNVPGVCPAPKIDEARKDYIIVNWQPPKENGGASMTVGAAFPIAPRSCERPSLRRHSSLLFM